MNTVRVMVADDHAVLVDAVVARLEVEPDLVVVGKAYHADAVEETAKRLRPDVLVLDIEFGDADGIDIALRLRESLPSTRVVMLTAHDDISTASTAVLAGISGFVAKDATSKELIDAIRVASSGDAWIQPRILRAVLDELADRGRAPKLTLDQEKLTRLTSREMHVFCHMVEGLDRESIARLLYLSTNTVRSHVRNLFGKLEVNTSLEAVTLGLRAGVRKAGDGSCQLCVADAPLQVAKRR